MDNKIATKIANKEKELRLAYTDTKLAFLYLRRLSRDNIKVLDTSVITKKIAESLGIDRKFLLARLAGVAAKEQATNEVLAALSKSPTRFKVPEVVTNVSQEECSRYINIQEEDEEQIREFVEDMKADGIAVKKGRWNYDPETNSFTD